MSEENQNTGQILDDGQIDKRLKDRILDARDRVADREDDTFVGAPLNGDVTLSQGQLVNIWATSVRQFLRAIEPLLKSDDIENAGHYYHNIPIFEDVLYPPDGETVVVTTDTGDTDTATESTIKEIHWSIFYTDDISTQKVTREHDLLSTSFTPPEPEPIKLQGLKSILETDALSASWTVPLNPGTPPAEDTYLAKPQINRPLTKPILEHAVRKADEFLHNAGFSPEIGGSTKVDSI